jgi:secreted PhoX family phosphatase
MIFNRRALIGGGAAALAFSGLARAQAETYVNEVEGYGALKADPNGVIDLPEGFSYQVISQGGETMADGLLVPGQFDGMGCFSLGGSRVALVRNHELKSTTAAHRNLGPLGIHRDRGGAFDHAKAYGAFKDGRPLPGGTTTVIYDLESRRTERQFLSLTGTNTNCAGGMTPWGSWLTCEETEINPTNADVTQWHGYVFEVPSRANGLVQAVPLKAMGRFDHEAVCIDPRTGIAYLTEDKVDGLFYRFIPNVKGELAKGGKLQAMAIRGAKSAVTTNHKEPIWAPGDWREVEWIDLEEIDSPNGDLRKRGHVAGAATVARGEGVFWGKGELYLTATSGGPIQRGQILRYVPSPDEGSATETRRPGRLQLFVETRDEKVLNMGDNLVVAPWGHLIVCEDNYSEVLRNHVKGVTPEGKVYAIARNVYPGNAEFCGSVFSPDGQVLFVNVQQPGLTIAIRGPWAALKA